MVLSFFLRKADAPACLLRGATVRGPLATCGRVRRPASDGRPDGDAVPPGKGCIKARPGPEAPLRPGPTHYAGWRRRGYPGVALGTPASASAPGATSPGIRTHGPSPCGRWAHGQKPRRPAQGPPQGQSGLDDPTPPLLKDLGFMADDHVDEPIHGRPLARQSAVGENERQRLFAEDKQHPLSPSERATSRPLSIGGRADTTSHLPLGEG